MQLEQCIALVLCRSNLEEGFLLFITNIAKSQDDFVATGLFLKPSRATDMEQNQWIAYSPEHPTQPILLQRYYIDWVGSGVSGEGHHTTFFDGEEYAADFSRELREAAQNLITVVTKQFLSTENLPFFLGFDQQILQSEQKAVVDLSITRLADLPDVQAYLDDNEMVNSDLGGADNQHLTTGRSISPRASALTVEIEADILLPIQVDIGGLTIYGAMHLHQRLSEKAFACTIYTSSRIILQPGMQLRRDLSWQKLGKVKSCSLHIGTIQSC